MSRAACEPMKPAAPVINMFFSNFMLFDVVFDSTKLASKSDKFSYRPYDCLFEDFGLTG
jgi:hypothetical protein